VYLFALYKISHSITINLVSVFGGEQGSVEFCDNEVQLNDSNFLKLNKHFNENKCELTFLNKEEKYVNQSGHTHFTLNSLQFMVGLKKLLTVRMTPGG
jgi:hypothetical protein